jgi:hypothetical protein
MATAKFNGKSCPMCGAEFIAGESQIEPHPTERGPRGGKVWVCAEHVHGAMSNPRSYQKGKGKFRQTPKSVGERNRYFDMFERTYFEGGPGEHAEFRKYSKKPASRLQQVENPFENAGRRTKKGQPNVYAKGKKQGQARLPRLAAAASCDYSAMPVGTYDKASKTFSGGLVGQAAGGDAGAAAELARRGRAITGHKLAWQKKASNVRVAANPFGF